MGAERADWRRGVRAPRTTDFAAAIETARALLGGVLACERDGAIAAGRIVEVEAYLSDADAASHSRCGPTARNATMFGWPGRAYVYLSYGMHRCVNVVTGPRGRGEAVLVRALEPLEGLEAMRARRGEVAQRDLCNGPGKLCEALGIELAHDGADLRRGALRLWLPRTPHPERAIHVGPRIGITRDAHLPLRFVLRGSPFVSRRVRDA